VTVRTSLCFNPCVFEAGETMKSMSVRDGCNRDSMYVIAYMCCVMYV